jgi:hypothetical protein
MKQLDDFIKLECKYHVTTDLTYVPTFLFPNIYITNMDAKLTSEVGGKRHLQHASTFCAVTDLRASNVSLHEFFLDNAK